MDEGRGKVVLVDMLSHDDVLEQFPWLSAQILNRWRRLGALRFFRGARGTIWYPQQDLNKALEADLQRETPTTSTPKQNMVHGSSPDADEVRERMFLKSFEVNGNTKGIKRGPRKLKSAVPEK